MPIKITVSDRLRFKVAGTITNEAGVRQAFDFALLAKRLEADVLRERLAPGSTELLGDFMTSIVDGWAGVRDDDGADLPFSADAFAQLLRIPGLGAMAMEAYVLEVGARAKN